MEFTKAREEFIHTWGTLGTNWGINRTMAQIHALLLIATEPMNADQIMEGLKISRGNANMNLHALRDWELIYKKEIKGQRKDYFVAEKDIWLMVQRITAQRKKKELDPLIKTLEELSEVDANTTEKQAFKTVVSDIHDFADQANKMLTSVMKSDNKWFAKVFLKLWR